MKTRLFLVPLSTISDAYVVELWHDRRAGVWGRWLRGGRF